VGDFRAAAASAETWFDEDLGRGWLFFTFRCRNASSLCSLIRMERFAGAISSPDVESIDLDRV
jgi:hypothetical protein